MTVKDVESITNAWDQIATGYDEFVTPTHLSLARQGLELAGLGSGDRFLDVAAGSGALSIPAARAGAKVTATDISPTMIERLRLRSEDEGLAIEARVMDGHALDLDDDSFDISGSQYGVMLFPDLPRGLEEMVRVTKRGGRVLMTVFGAPSQVEFLSFFMGAIKAVVPGFKGLPSDPPPLPFQVADPRKLKAELETAGLTDVEVTRTTEKLEFSSAQQMWDWLTNSNPIGAGLVAGLSDDQASGVRHVLGEMLRERSQGDGPAILTNPVNIGIGVKR